MKKVKKNVRWTKKLKNQKFERINFEELTVFSKAIKNCEFFEIGFKHSSLGSKTIYKNCKFVKCDFSGKYTSLGNQVDYIDCVFEDCTFQGNTIFMGSIFKNCKLSGKMKNNILTNEKRFLKKPYKFDSCDLKEVAFDNIAFNGNRFFNACKLPTSSIRLFRNENDELINYARNQIAILPNDLNNSLSIIFDKEIRSGFNPFVVDIPFLEDFLEISEKLEFEKIVREFEIKISL